ncbi:MAG: hypothetical protein AAGA21_22010 [Pseudomonadota bacterium]
MSSSFSPGDHQPDMLAALRAICAERRTRFEHERQRLSRASEVDFDDISHVAHELNLIEDSERFLDEIEAAMKAG